MWWWFAIWAVKSSRWLLILLDDKNSETLKMALKVKTKLRRWQNMFLRKMLK